MRTINRLKGIASGLSDSGGQGRFLTDATLLRLVLDEDRIAESWRLRYRCDDGSIELEIKARPQPILRCWGSPKAPQRRSQSAFCHWCWTTGAIRRRWRHDADAAGYRSVRVYDSELWPIDPMRGWIETRHGNTGSRKALYPAAPEQQARGLIGDGSMQGHEFGFEIGSRTWLVLEAADYIATPNKGRRVFSMQAGIPKWADSESRPNSASRRIVRRRAVDEPDMMQRHLARLQFERYRLERVNLYFHLLASNQQIISRGPVRVRQLIAHMGAGNDLHGSTVRGAGR